VLYVMSTSDEARQLRSPLPGAGKLSLVYRIAGKLNRRPVSRLSRMLDRSYNAWRHLRLAVNGLGLRRLASQQDSAAQALHALQGKAAQFETSLDAHQARIEAFEEPVSQVPLHAAQLQDHGSRLQEHQTDLQSQRQDLNLHRARI